MPIAEFRQKKKFDTKKWVLICMAILGGFIILFILWNTVWFFMTFGTYRNQKQGLEMVYPRTWQVKENPAKGVVVAFLSPKENALDSFTDNVNFSTFDMSKKVLSTDEYAQKIAAEMQTGFADLKLVQKGSFPVGGHKGYRMLFRSVGKIKVFILVYVFTIDDMGYNMLYVGSIDKFRKDLTMLELMAIFLKVKY